MPSTRRRTRQKQKGRGLVQSALGALGFNDPAQRSLLTSLMNTQKSIAEIEQEIDTKGVDLNKLLSAGDGLIHFLASSDDLNANLNILIQKGASVELKARDGTTPLILAAKSDAVENVITLIRWGARLFERDQTGATAMWWAAHLGHANVVRVLLHAGANGDVSNNEGVSAFDSIYSNLDIEGDDIDDEEVREEMYSRIVDIRKYLCMAGSRHSECPEILESERQHQETLRQLRIQLNAIRRTQPQSTEIEVTNVGEIELPRYTVIDEKTGEKLPIRNTITLENIENGNAMVNFDDEMKSGRYYKKNSFNMYKNSLQKTHQNIINPSTRQQIKKMKTYTARLRNNSNKKSRRNRRSKKN